jgi:multiple sugar transport system permease protein
MTRGWNTFRQSLGGYAFIAPWLVGFLIFTAGPMIASLVISLLSWSMLSSPTWVGLENYQSIITEDPLFRS